MFVLPFPFGGHVHELKSFDAKFHSNCLRLYEDIDFVVPFGQLSGVSL